MQSQISYPEVLPLQGESGYSRRIFIDSCRSDDKHLQVRGELVDNRADYQETEREIAIHGMVVLLTIDIESKLITDAEFAFPQMAFKGICAEQMPAQASQLLGVNARKGFQGKINEIFGGTRSCMHLTTLLKSMALAITQVDVWNNTFKMVDTLDSPELVPQIMEGIRGGVENSCHAWAVDVGGVSRDFAEGNYGPMLERGMPELLVKWKHYKEENE